MITATPAICPSHVALVAIVKSKSNSNRVSLYDEKCGADGTRRAILITGKRSWIVSLSSSAFNYRRL